MDEFNYEKEEETVEQEDASGTDASDEEDFLKCYSDDEEVIECAECGVAVREEKKVVRDIDGEKYVFCSKECAEEFEESTGE